MKLYILKDEKVGYMNVILDHNDEIAKYNFGKGLYSDNPELGRMEDYSLYSIADFDVSNGVHNVTDPVFVINGLTAYNDFVSLLNSRHVEKLKGDEDNGYVDVAKEDE